MKKECERTRRSFPRYLRGHVFRIERVRIERHLAECVICRSEFEGLKRADETRRILKDIDISENIIDRVKDGVVSLSRLKKVLYRPLWLATILLAAVGIYHYIVTPRQLDLEIERIVRTEPATTPSLPPAGVKTAMSISIRPADNARALEAPSAPVAAPLVVTIIPDNENVALRQINEIMSIYEQLREQEFSETVRVVSGSLTVKELEIFFERIESVARVNFNHKQIESISSTQSIPFTLRLLSAPQNVESHPLSATPAPVPVQTQTPTGTAIPAEPAASPTTSRVE